MGLPMVSELMWARHRLPVQVEEFLKRLQKVRLWAHVYRNRATREWGC